MIPRYAAPRSWHAHQFDDPHWGRAPGHEQQVLSPDDLHRLAAEIRTALAPPSSAPADHR